MLNGYEIGFRIGLGYLILLLGSLLLLGIIPKLNLGGLIRLTHVPVGNKSKRGRVNYKRIRKMANHQPHRTGENTAQISRCGDRNVRGGH